ncbi:MAG TPA: metal ABC transporter substrate-binding protein [Candidatus Limnocylindrales bacterium]|nr:metal ABC transporter substrate-binding protein [Candidatus Limnocylindrales bacterium]
MPRLLLALALLAAVLAACSGGPATPPSDVLRVVATTTVLADLVKHVGRDDVAVTSIVPKGGVVETFDPSPRDIASISEADLVVMNGLGLDNWLERVVDAAAPDVPVVRLGEDLPGAAYIGEDGGTNPHLWLDVSNGVRYAERIRDALVTADPANSDAYRTGGDAYVARLRELDGWVRERVDSVPSGNRKLVSFHEAFPYFAQAYGLEIVGSVLGVPGQEPAAGEVAALVDSIRESGAKAVFTEAGFNPGLAESIASEAGVAVESDLYNDSLGDPPVDTYEGLIRWDTQRIVEALGGQG